MITLDKQECYLIYVDNHRWPDLDYRKDEPLCNAKKIELRGPYEYSFSEASKQYYVELFNISPFSVSERMVIDQDAWLSKKDAIFFVETSLHLEEEKLNFQFENLKKIKTQLKEFQNEIS